MEYVKMDPVLKAQWVEALRSGTYGQCTGTLRRGDDFCCLGVLADLVPERKWINAATKRMERVVLPGDFTGSRFINLPKFLVSEEAQATLMPMNDGDDAHNPPIRKQSFAEIADWIEENL